MERYFCKHGEHYVDEQAFYLQGGICKKCRSKIQQTRIETLEGISLAEYLLHESCRNALSRTRDPKNETYRGVKCDWEKPSDMKLVLMKNEKFWEDWLKQSQIYEKEGRIKKFRPTLDRIESDVEKGGHYTMNNIQMLSHRDNVIKENKISCIALFIKDLRIVKVAKYESIKNTMKELGISAYNTINTFKDKGKIYNIGNGYSILLQTMGGIFEGGESPLYKVVSTRKRILIDYDTGKEYIISNEQVKFESPGIWFTLDNLMGR